MIDRSLIPLASAALLALALLVALAGLGFWSAVHPPRYRSATTPASFGWGYETVAFQTADGLTLRGWLIPRAGDPLYEDRRVVMLLHGYPFDKGNILSVAPLVHDHVHLLVFDFRGFGESDGTGTTIGYREQEDVLGALEFLRGRGFDRIGAFGFSMGAATALMAAGRTDRLRVVISDSAYADLGMMARAYYGNLPLLSEPLAWLTRLFGRMSFGVDPADVSPARSLAQVRIPVLVIHSTGDDQIGLENAHRLQAALAQNRQAEFWFADAAGHGSAFALHPAEYEGRVVDFLQRHL